MSSKAWALRMLEEGDVNAGSQQPFIGEAQAELYCNPYWNIGTIVIVQ